MQSKPKQFGTIKCGSFFRATHPFDKTPEHFIKTQQIEYGHCRTNVTNAVRLSNGQHYWFTEIDPVVTVIGTVSESF